MKRFRCGLVVGKFSPLHLGHEYLIRRVLDECAEVAIISYSKPEFYGCEAAQRERWLAELFREARRLVLNDEILVRLASSTSDWTRLPHNNDDAISHRRFCAYLCSDILKVDIDAVFTSENYGAGFAAELTLHYRQKAPAHPIIEHISVDQDRQLLPISGTRLRAEVHRLKQWLSPRVYASFVQRICFLGGESSGKSILARVVAEHYQTEYVAEYGRQLWEEKHGNLVYDDLLLIAERQVALEEAAACRAHRFLFCDTSPLTTLFYCRELFGKAPPELNVLAGRAYDLVVLCAPDFPFVQDGTRKDPSFRLRQHDWYLRELTERKIAYLLATGSIEDRVRQVGESLMRGFVVHAELLHSSGLPALPA